MMAILTEIGSSESSPPTQYPSPDSGACNLASLVPDRVSGINRTASSAIVLDNEVIKQYRDT